MIYKAIKNTQKALMLILLILGSAANTISPNHNIVIQENRELDNTPELKTKDFVKEDIDGSYYGYIEYDEDNFNHIKEPNFSPVTEALLAYDGQESQFFHHEFDNGEVIKGYDRWLVELPYRVGSITFTLEAQFAGVGPINMNAATNPLAKLLEGIGYYSDYDLDDPEYTDSNVVNMIIEESLPLYVEIDVFGGEYTGTITPHRGDTYYLNASFTISPTYNKFYLYTATGIGYSYQIENRNSYVNPFAMKMYHDYDSSVTYQNYADWSLSCSYQYDELVISTGGSRNVILDVDDKINKESIVSKVTAFDSGDNASVPVIITDDTCPVIFDVIGNCEIHFEASDSSGNIATAEIYVTTMSFKPIITGAEVYNTSYQLKIDIDTIISNLIVTDHNDAELSKDCLSIKSNEYLNHEIIPGSYEIVFSAVYNSKTSDDFVVTINVFDEIPPYFIIDDTIITHFNNKLTHENIRVALEISNKITLNNFVITKDEYSENFKTLGVYNIEYSYLNNDETIISRAIIKVEDLSSNMPTLTDYSNTLFDQILENLANIWNSSTSAVTNFFQSSVSFLEQNLLIAIIALGVIILLFVISIIKKENRKQSRKHNKWRK